MVGTDAVVAGIGTGVLSGGVTGVAGAATTKFGEMCTWMGYKGFGLYPCCGGDLNAQGCFKYYNCCERELSSRGCEDLAENKRTYRCCKGNSHSTGCTSSYSCCGKSKNNAGCVTQCNVCNKSINITEIDCGYKMKCCGITGFINDKDDNKDGCKQRCEQCKCEWGKPLLPNDLYWKQKKLERPNNRQGCSGDFEHDMKILNNTIDHH